MSARISTQNGITTLRTQADKLVALFPRIPRTQYNFIVDLAKGDALVALKVKLGQMSADRVIAFRYDLQLMQVEQHRITCFEQVRATSQRGAAGLYKASLATLIAAANDALKAKDEPEPNLFFGYDDLTARDAVAAAAEGMAVVG